MRLPEPVCACAHAWVHSHDHYQNFAYDYDMRTLLVNLAHMVRCDSSQP